ncbi:hypothetical protein Q31b_25880 [Novipirellula aureliae]|uniref:Uncharacterized protein n=1 Tax=Novipirellula aureliae TaxID=2527966 RepID=A0A5C6E6G1_9BACT|nr:hypothetical protein [Novipirellula aureliae]TWU43547.1 hypothetical protein Q31b_25880 [Novipirellula aureliae]
MMTVSPADRIAVRPPRIFLWCFGICAAIGLLGGVTWSIFADLNPDLIYHLDKGHIEVMVCLSLGAIVGAVLGIIVDGVCTILRFVKHRTAIAQSLDETRILE